MENNFLYNLSPDSSEFRFARVYESAAWFVFIILLVVFKGYKCLSLRCDMNFVIELKSLCNAFVLYSNLRLYRFGRFLVFFLYTFSCEVFVLFLFYFTIVVRFFSKNQEVIVAFDFFYIFAELVLKNVFDFSKLIFSIVRLQNLFLG